MLVKGGAKCDFLSAGARYQNLGRSIPPFILFFVPGFINTGRKRTFCGAVGANLSLGGDQPDSARVKPPVHLLPQPLTSV